MKVSILIPSGGGGGAEKVIVQLANELAKDPLVQVDLVFYRAVGPNIADIDPAVNIVDLDISERMAIIFKARKYLMNDQPDVFIARMHPVVVLAGIAMLGLRRKPKVTIGVFDSMRPIEQRSGFVALIRKWKDRLLGALFRKYDGLIGVSEGVVAQYRTLYVIPQNQIQVVHNPIDIQSIVERSKEPIHHPWINSAEKLVLAIGRFVPVKEFENLLKAFKLVCQEIPAKLIILGDGPKRGDLECLRTELSLEDQVDFLGYETNPYAFMRAADLYVLSSSREGLPTVLLEALAVGTPIVATDCESGPAEILCAGEWGSLVPVDDINALAEALKISLGLRAALRQPSQRAFDLALEK